MNRELEMQQIRNEAEVRLYDRIKRLEALIRRVQAQCFCQPTCQSEGGFFVCHICRAFENAKRSG